MRFREVLKGYPTDQQKTVNKILDQFKGDQTSEAMLFNLEQETRLQEKHWKSFIDRLLKDPKPGNPSELIRQVSQKNTLKGPLVTVPEERRLIRIIKMETFAEYLFESGDFAKEEDVLETIENLIGKDPKALPPIRLRYQLGKWLIWTTFNTKGIGKFQSLSGRQIYCSLGLDEELKSDDHLLIFCFILPTKVKTLFPTFFDGYAGKTWNKCFRVAQPSEKHGWTRHQDPCACGFAIGRPETVHTVVSMENLRAPIKKWPFDDPLGAI